MKLKMLAAVAGLMVSLASASVVSAGETEDKVAKRLAEAVPGLTVVSVRESEAEGLYEVQSNNGDTIYTTQDGVYLLTGDLLKITGNGIANVTEEARAETRKRQMADFGDEGLISYPAKGEQKAVVDVFTDIDCPRSEEHTSELQSRPHLVCRLLLEK